MARRAIIFDVDGTLVDSVDLHTRAWQEALIDVGKKSAFSDIRNQIGKGSDMFLPCFLNKEELARFGHRVSKRQQQIFKDRYSKQVRPFSSVPELFRWLRKDGWTVVLASFGKRQEVNHHKKLVKIKHLTDLDVCSEDAENQNRMQTFLK